VSFSGFTARALPSRRVLPAGVGGPLRRWAFSLAVLTLVCWPAGTATAICVEPSAAKTWGSLTSGGSFYVEWAAEPGPLVLNEIGSLRVHVLDPEDRSPVAGAVVTVNGRMPEHKHGLNLHPRVEMEPDGSARVSGFLLHMEGQWEIEIGVALDGQMERARFTLDLEP